MPLSVDNSAVGETPPFKLQDAKVATVIELVCLGARSAKPRRPHCLDEPCITTRIGKAIRELKRSRGITNMEVYPEFNVLDEKRVKYVRIDILFKFDHQVGYEDAYVAIEGKKVEAGNRTLNRNYVELGMKRFSESKYARGNEWGFMLGLVLQLPVEDIESDISRHVERRYGINARLLKDRNAPHDALAMYDSVLPRMGGEIKMKHIFVDMTDEDATSAQETLHT